jgi:hypothetical protein
MSRIARSGLGLVGALLLWGPAEADDFAAAFLENGMGGRALGMGGAFTAVADDASAVFWNPAGLVWKKGGEALASLQSLSLDRQQSALAVRVNPRGDLAFGLSWQHAGTDGLTARDASGRPAGDIDDSQNAYYVGVARRLGDDLAVGITLKRLNHDLKVPGQGTSNGSGSAFDLGMRWRLDPRLSLGLTARNIGGRLDWSVPRSGGQNSETENNLGTSLALGAAFRPNGKVLVAASAVSGSGDTHVNLGFEWYLNPLLTVRAGMHRLPGDDNAVGSSSLGLTIRPMRTRHLQFHYAYTTDELDAGARNVAALSVVFH